MDRLMLLLTEPLPEFNIDIRRFVAEDEGRTEDPTDKKIQKARSDGNVPRSQELTGASMILFGFSLIYAIWPFFVRASMDHLAYMLEHLSELDITIGGFRTMTIEICLHILHVTWPVLLLAVFISIVSSLVQHGWLFTLNPLRPKLSNLIPKPQRVIEKFVPSKESLFQLGQSLSKIIICGFVGLSIVWSETNRLAFLMDMPIITGVDMVLRIAFKIILWIGILLLFLSVIDYAYQRYKWNDSLKMMKQEVKDEQRQAEGDPDVKRAQRRKMMEVVRRRMMRAIPEADVVITNPTHYAIAVKYEGGVMSAPKVIAKGEGFLALRIIEIARENGVPTYENKPLAQALYRGVEIGEEIPPEFYQAVAEVLAWVYRQKRERAI